MQKSLTSSTSPNAVRALLYARSAREDDSFPETNVNGQLKKLRSFIEAHGWVNQGEYADRGISGLTDDRPGLNGLMEACRNNRANVVVVTELSRLTRNLSLSLALLKQLGDMSVQVVEMQANNLIGKKRKMAPRSLVASSLKAIRFASQAPFNRKKKSAALKDECDQLRALHRR